jgi:hypothetical protein
MNHQQRHRARFECKGSLRKRLKQPGVLPPVFLNNLLIYQEKACSFVTVPYQCFCMMATPIFHAAIESKKLAGPSTTLVRVCHNRLSTVKPVPTVLVRAGWTF